MKPTAVNICWIVICLCLTCWSSPPFALADGKCIEGDCQDGKGTYEDDNGETYVGQFKHGTYDGNGVMRYPGGNQYTGEFRNGLRHGKGEIYWDGYTYTGGFAHGQYSGTGTLVCPNEDVYEGEFKAGYYSGMGKLTQGTGDVYTGAFKAGYYSGKGVLHLADGSRYKGDFLKGYYHGSGVLESNGDRYTGEFIKGRYSGQGTIIYADGNHYAGEFLNGHRHGKGVMAWNGDKYVGEFKRDRYSGSGTLLFENGDQYSGQFKKGKRHGFGAYTYGDGRTFTGVFVNDYKHDGTLTWGGDENRIKRWERSLKARFQISRVVASLIEKGDYEELERTASAYRRARALFPDGRWKLPVFYDAVAKVKRSAPEEDWLARLKQLQGWIKRKPESITAHLALAEFYYNYAFNARGHDYAKQVTDEGWALFRERLAQMASILDRAEELTEHCPHFWAAAISHAKGANADRATFDELIQKASAAEPLYFETYCRAAIYLLPRWHGEAKAWETFAETSADAVGGPVGDFLYAQIVIFMNGMPPNNVIMKESRDIIWPRVKRGLQAASKIEAAVKTMATTGSPNKT